MTQMEEAKKGNITPEMEKICEKERISTKEIITKVAEGKIVIPKNINRNTEACGIGEGLSTKINANIGSSSKIENIKRVYSHEQALMQCSEFLEKYPNWLKEKMNNTALSAKYIHEENNIENACIANLHTKEMYDLELLKDNINNQKENYTRFFIISNENIIIDGSEKISIVTSTDNKSGALMELLQILSNYNLNMVNLKSRPRISKPWEYYFYIDFEGNIKDKCVLKSLEEIREKSNYLQILGNYKIYNLKI